MSKPTNRGKGVISLCIYTRGLGDQGRGDRTKSSKLIIIPFSFRNSIVVGEQTFTLGTDRRGPLGACWEMYALGLEQLRRTQSTRSDVKNLELLVSDTRQVVEAEGRASLPFW